LLRYVQLAKRPVQFKSFVGLDVAEFDSLYATVESRYEEFEQKRLSRTERKRSIGAGRPFEHLLKDRLLMLLVYYRLYVTSILVGYLFDLDQTNVLRDIRRLEPLVKDCVPLPKKIYESTRRARTLEEVEEYFPGFIAIIDSFEQEIPRPKNKRRRKSYYSGKRKKHTVKTQLAVNKDGLVIHRTDHVRGRRHDYDLFKENHPKLPDGVSGAFDLGYQGVKKDLPELNAMIPFKRNRWHPRKLSKEKRKFNTKLSRTRVVVEHAISRLKKFRILGEEFRNRLPHYNVMTNIVSGIVNMRMLGDKSSLFV